LTRPLAALLALATLARGQAVPVSTGFHHKVILQVEALRADGTWRPLRMMLDTGAQDCLLTPEAAREVTTAPFRRSGLTGFAGSDRPALARKVRALRSGDQLQSEVAVMVTDLEGVNRWLDEPLDGILGLSFLRGRTFTVDLQAGTLRWGGPVPPGREVPLRDRGGDGRPWIDVRVGTAVHPALVDTGASVALVVPASTPGLDLLPECDLAAGVDGTRTIREGRIGLEALGEVHPHRKAVVGGGALILGVPFLLAGSATFDLKGGRLILEVRDGHLPAWHADREGARALPVAWNRKGTVPALEVQDLPRCHRWYRAGFRRGDRVRAVGPLQGPALTLEALDRRLARGEILSWTLLRRGQEIHLENPDEDPRKEPLDPQP
jgi:predicted aspartyl protease